MADQKPGQTVRELARLLCHGGNGAPRYVEGELHQVIVPVRRLQSLQEAQQKAAAEKKPSPGSPSDFYVEQQQQQDQSPRVDTNDLGLKLTDYLLSRYRPAERDNLYESTRISLRRQADGTQLDVYELYWADYSRLQPGGMRALSASYQLFFHLNTLARDVVDQAALSAAASNEPTPALHRIGLRGLQTLHALSAWLLRGPGALLQFGMLLLVIFGFAALVPPDRQPFLLGLIGAVTAFACSVFVLLAAQRAGDGAQWRKAAPWIVGALAGLAATVTALLVQYAIATVYFAAAGVLMMVLGVALVRRYGSLVDGVRWSGLLIVFATALLLAVNAWRGLPYASTQYEWMLVAALHTGEYLLAALLIVWAAQVIVQSAAALLSFVLASSPTSSNKRELAASLVTARIGMIVSTALFAVLSVLLWTAIAFFIGKELDQLLFEPALFGSGYRAVPIWLEAQVQDVGTLFAPLIVFASVIGVFVVIALAPSLREELSPHAEPQAQSWAARLGRWWTGGRRWLAVIFSVVLPLLAVAGGLVYLQLVLFKLGGIGEALELGGSAFGDALVKAGKWLAGGAITIAALGARFTNTFGKLRVALDAVLDVDNYFRDPISRRPPRARIFSRFAALLDYIRQGNYTRVVIVAHSQGSVISADLLRYLHCTDRLHEHTGGMPLALVTVGSPLRDLYAARFPLLYRWLGASPASFENAAPSASDAGLTQWINAYRSGDYVGRAIWTTADEASMFRVATVDANRSVHATRAADRTEFCIGSGAHTHYFSDDAVALAMEIDRVVAGHEAA